MGMRQSKRSVDITTTPKKDGIPTEGNEAAPVDGKLERIEEAESTKPTTNGVAPHTDSTEDDKDKDENTEKDKVYKRETRLYVHIPWLNAIHNFLYTMQLFFFLPFFADTGINFTRCGGFPL